MFIVVNSIYFGRTCLHVSHIGNVRHREGFGYISYWISYASIDKEVNGRVQKFYKIWKMFKGQIIMIHSMIGKSSMSFSS